MVSSLVICPSQIHNVSICCLTCVVGRENPKWQKELHKFDSYTTFIKFIFNPVGSNLDINQDSLRNYSLYAY